ncbi:MAG: leucyl/phenylalanyl-tRNA--protein transferase [Verrucomicrobiota bacterium]
MAWPLPPGMVLDEHLRFPDPHKATAEGLVAVGGDFAPERLLLAYRSGIFPWTDNPISWWSPDPRGIFELEQFHVPRSLEKFLRKNPYTITTDRAFRAVIEGCAVPDARRGKTWITPRFIEAYTLLHQQGHAHSVECWRGNELVGGIYGVAVGGLFAGESMFHRADNASKVALHHLVTHLRAKGFALFDIQMITDTTRQLGAMEIPRSLYLECLSRATDMKCTF